MRWLIALVFLAGSSFFLYQQFNRQIAAPPEIPPAPGALEKEPLAFLSIEEMRKVRQSAQDGEPAVRWAAVELLVAFKDPEALTVLEKTIADDPDPEIRMKAVRLLKDNNTLSSLRGLIRGLQDSEKDIRIASLRAIGDIGDPAATPWVTETLRDVEPEVKMEALRTLGRFQDKRKEEFAALAQRLREEYESAVKRARENAE